MTRMPLSKSRHVSSGKSGPITELLKGMAKLSPEERKATGAAINKAKEAIESSLNSRREAIRRLRLEARLAEESLDVTLPGRGETRGGLHPVTRSLERIEGLFRSIGFEVADGPEIEADFQNFTALNTPEDHPARSMHDTFYLQGEDGTTQENVLLRTHTSPIKVRYMQAHRGEIRAPRVDAGDPRHRARTCLPCRFGRNSLTHVSSGGRFVDRRKSQLCRP